MIATSLVKRPNVPFTGGRAAKYPIQAVLDTLDTKQALHIEARGADLLRLINALGKAVKSRRADLRFRHVRDDSGLVTWVEKRRDGSR